MKKLSRILTLGLAVLMIACLIAGCQQEKDTAAIMRQARNGVVRVYCETVVQQGNEQYGYFSTGTAFGIGDEGEDTDTFVTNWHVVTNGYNQLNDKIYILLESDLVTYEQVPYGDDWALLDVVKSDRFDKYAVECEVLYTTIDSNGSPDIAIIKAKKKISGVKALPLLETREGIKEGEVVYALGYPGALDDDALEAGEYSYRQPLRAGIEDIAMTQGTVTRFSVMASVGDTKVITHSAHINHGNSGGPLLNKDGAVVGINTYGNVEDSSYVSSIYIDYAMDKLDDLHIDYDIYTEKTGVSSVVWIVAAAAVAAVVVLVVVLVTKKPSQPARVPAGPAPVQQPAAPPAAPVNVAPMGVAGGMAGHAVGAAPRVQPAARTVTLRATGTALPGRTWTITPRAVTMGRDNTCAVLFPADTRGISRNHCSLRAATSTDGAVIMDMGSSYGTFVRGARIQPNTPVRLHRGDSFYLGQPSCSFRIE